MNCEQANRIPISEYLERLNVHPVVKRNSYFMYLSPIRDEKTASFRVSLKENLFIDYGLSGVAGTLVTLVLHMGAVSVQQALEQIGKVMNSEVPVSSFPLQTHNALNPESDKLIISRVKDLGHNIPLADYIQSRGINPRFARRFCKEVYYEINGKKYFAIGFKNNSDGYEIRNKYFKGSSSPKDISFINNGSSSLTVFEGFMDFLSALTIRDHEKSNSNFLILNSLSLIKRCHQILGAHKDIFLLLDKDTAGRNATNEMLQKYKQAIDCSNFYRDFKDLNEFLMQSKGLINKRPTTTRSKEQSQCSSRASAKGTTCKSRVESQAAPTRTTNFI